MGKFPEVRVYAGPNGSGKSTFSQVIGTFGKYINADEIKKQLSCSDLEAAKIAESLRIEAVNSGIDFSFETVLSTNRNIEFLKIAKQKGYFIKMFYVLTKDPRINVQRIETRMQKGGHSVPEQKTLSRYRKALQLVPQLLEICDVIHVYDNSDYFQRIFKKRKNDFFLYENDIWTAREIEILTGISK